MALTLKHLQNVCLVHQGNAQCRYAEQDDFDRTRWYCMKKTGMREMIDEDAELVLKNRLDGSTPVGDNCPGYPMLREVPQGYDVKP